MQEFFIKDQANEGIKLPLQHPDGTVTQHWIQVLSRFSDAAKKAEAEYSWNDLVSEMRLDDIRGEKTKAFIHSRRLGRAAALIKDWSFPEPCTEQARMDFLDKAPQILEMVEVVGSRLDLFIKKK